MLQPKLPDEEIKNNPNLQKKLFEIVRLDGKDIEQVIGDSEHQSGSEPIEIANLKETSEDKAQESAKGLALIKFWALD